jgi:hypothetical protein
MEIVLATESRSYAKRRAGETALANLGPRARQARREAMVRLDATGPGNQPMRLGVSSWGEMS